MPRAPDKPAPKLQATKVPPATRTHPPRHEDLPVEDARLLRQLDWLPSGRITLRDCAPALGFRPTRMTVALSRPHHGYCYKVVAAFLP